MMYWHWLMGISEGDSLKVASPTERQMWIRECPTQQLLVGEESEFM